MTHASPAQDLRQRLGLSGASTLKFASELPLALRAAAAALNVGSSQRELLHEQHQRLQAERMNRAIAEFQARKMQQVELGASHAYMRPTLLVGRSREDGEIGLSTGGEVSLPPSMYGTPRPVYGSQVPFGFDEGMVRLAEAMGEDLAKTAGIGSGLGSLLKGVGSGLGGLGKGIAQGGAGLAQRGVSAFNQAGEKAIGSLVSAPSAAKNGVGSWANRVGQKLEQAGTNAQKSLQGAGQNVARAGAGVPPVSATAGPQQVSKTTSAVTATTPAPKPALQTAPASAPQAAPEKPAGPPTTTATVPQAQPATPGAPGMIDKAKDWLVNRAGITPGKMMGLAGGLAAIGGVYAGAKKLKDVMSQESAPAQYGSGATPAAGINEYGQPQRGTPFAY